MLSRGPARPPRARLAIRSRHGHPPGTPSAVLPPNPPKHPPESASPGRGGTGGDPPWWTDDEPRPRGVVSRSPGAEPLPKEVDLAEELAEHGNFIRFLPTNPLQKSADALVGRTRPSDMVEFKRLDPPGTHTSAVQWKALYNVINQSLSGGGQARSIVVDTRLRPGVSAGDLPALVEHIAKHRRGRLDFIRVMGVDFDVTLRGP